MDGKALIDAHHQQLGVPPIVRWQCPLHSAWSRHGEAFVVYLLITLPRCQKGPRLVLNQIYCISSSWLTWPTPRRRERRPPRMPEKVPQGWQIEAARVSDSTASRLKVVTMSTLDVKPRSVPGPVKLKDVNYEVSTQKQQDVKYELGDNLSPDTKQAVFLANKLFSKRYTHFNAAPVLTKCVDGHKCHQHAICVLSGVFPPLRLSWSCMINLPSTSP